MSDLQRVRYGFRFVDTDYGDTLQEIAARELGDAARWTDLVAYNNLLAPFITDDPALAGPRVLLSGQPIKVPAPTAASDSATKPGAVFGSDIQLSPSGEVMTNGSDFVLVSGPDNLVQALGNRIRTERGDLMWHQDYGCDLRRMIGHVNGPTKSLLASQLVKAGVRADPRIARAVNAKATVAADVVRVEVTAETVAGLSVQAAASV